VHNESAVVRTAALGRPGIVAQPGLVSRLGARLSRVTVVVHDYDAAIDFSETFGRVAVFLDMAGNRWDLRGPA
jgi:hypothetical protein